MRVRIHVQGWSGSRSIKKGEEPDALLRGVLEVDGHRIEEAIRCEVTFSGEFVTVKAHLLPGSFEVVTHDDESWPALMLEIDEARRERRQAVAGTGRHVADAGAKE